jgi:hypothetical protein
MVCHALLCRTCINLEIGGQRAETVVMPWLFGWRSQMMCCGGSGGWTRLMLGAKPSKLTGRFKSPISNQRVSCSNKYIFSSVMSNMKPFTYKMATGCFARCLTARWAETHAIEWKCNRPGDLRPDARHIRIMVQSSLNQRPDNDS